LIDPWLHGKRASCSIPAPSCRKTGPIADLPKPLAVFPMPVAGLVLLHFESFKAENRAEKPLGCTATRFFSIVSRVYYSARHLINSATRAGNIGMADTPGAWFG